MSAKNNFSILSCFLTAFLWSANLAAQASFVTNGQSFTSPNSWDIRLADIDGDKDLDAYFEGMVWLNNGNGQFAKTVTSFGGDAYFADFNGDAKIDIVCNNNIFLNDGVYHFNLNSHLTTNMTMNYAQPADIDNNGDFDIVVADQYTDSIFINDGKGNFTNARKSFGGWGQSRYAFGDINGDGFTDVYVAIPHIPPMGGHTSNKIWLSNGNGNFTEKNHDISGAESRDAILADFDGDSDIDLFVSDAASGGRIFFNDGAGNLKNSDQKLGNKSGAAKVADFDEDDDLDLLICYGSVPFGNGAPNLVWLNDGKGNFTDSGLRLGNSNSAALALGDLNNDSKMDAFIVNVKLDNTTYSPVSCPVEIWINNSFICNYLNEPRPGNIPLLYGKGIVSVEGKNNHACTFHPDGNMLIFSRYPEKKSYVMTFSNGQWTSPVEAFFEGKETSFSADGNKVFYYKNDGDIYYTEKSEKGWGNSISLGNIINTSETEYYPSVTSDGTLFFSRNGSWNEARIFYSEYKNGQYSTPIDLGLPINTGGALHAFVAPDKSYILFNSPRAGSYTSLDIWISYHNSNNTWTSPQNLGESINSGADAILCPTVSPDGKYMFFTKMNFTTGTGNVYWVSTSFIESLRPSTGIIKIESIDYHDITIFPNPTNGKFYINRRDLTNKTTAIQIFNTQGSNLMNKTFLGIENITIDLTPYPKGIYAIKLNVEGNIYNKKICLE